jgi:tRNA (guanine6-N2)-methyltransferase
VGPHKEHLIDVEKQIRELDLSFINKERQSYMVNASRTGKHTYSRFEAANAAMRGIAKRSPRWPQGTSENHDVEFHLDIQQEAAMFSLRLTDAAFRYRGENRLFSQAALRPTVAHAFVWLSKPEASDVFVDPCCGSGTIVSERLTYPYSRVVGGISRKRPRVLQKKIWDCIRMRKLVSGMPGTFRLNPVMLIRL